MASARETPDGTTDRRWCRGRLALAGTAGVAIGLGLAVAGSLSGAVTGGKPVTVSPGVDQPLAVAVAVAEPELAAFLDRWCLGCHSGDEPEADLDLDPMWTRVRAGTPAGSTVEAIERSRMLRHVRRRLADGSMPPSRRRPDDAAYRTAIDATDRVLATLAARAGTAAAVGEAATLGVRNAPVRRLTRLEYATAIRDLLGVDFDPALLPSEEIGHGFDTNGGTLSLSPLRFEQYVEAAERIARDAVVDAGAARERRRRTADQLERRGNGRLGDDAVVLFSSGAAVAGFDVVAAGRYRVVAAVAGDQAGPELVRMQLRDLGGGGTGRMLHEMEVAGQWEPARLETTVDLPEGTFTVGAAFVNDYYDADAADPAQRDRNAAVAWIELDGPLSPPEPTPLQRALTARFGAEPAAWRPAIVHLAERAWRRPLTAEDAAGLLEAVDAAAEAEQDAGGAATTPAALAIDPRRLRIGITAILAHPRFLFRLETDPSPGEPMRRLDGHELAARLALLAFSSVPDEALARDAAAGRLDHVAGRRAALDRLLADPRSLALSEHFAAQWLRIRALANRRPDAERFPGVDADLREAMRMETVLFFDAMLREDRPVSHLVTSSETFVNEALARHYGIPGVRGPHMRRVALDGLRRGLVPDAGRDAGDADGLGVLRHASILLTTSNPTRTSPVMRGKWVLESLLDDPPPPAPAFVPALARNGEPTEHETLRELLEQHRADPTCAACHRRMDPLGFALEPFDAVGRPRRVVDGTTVDASAELPDGTRFDGPAGLRDLLLGARRPDLVRSLLRHLATYALGRGLDPADDLWIEPALAGLGDDPTVRELLLVVIESPPFLHRFPPSRDDA